MTPQEKRNLRTGLLFVLPWLIGLGAFLLFPIASSFYYSFCDYSVLKPPFFIGPENYRDLMGDEVFWISLGNTLYYAVFAIGLGTFLSLSTALLLNTRVKGMAVYRTCFFLPSLVPIVASAILWQWIFNGSFGILNHFLSWFGIEGPAWLADSTWSKPAIILMGLWGVGNTVVIYLAGLQDVPEVLYEAAEIDGAGFWGKLWHVTLPLISPVIYFNVIMSIIYTLQIFAGPYIMTTGGPGRSTTFYTMYLYEVAFEDLRMGYASAMAWILFLLIFGLTCLATRISKKHIHYGEGA